MFAVVLLQVLFRYAIDWPLVWSEELSRYLFVWLALLGWTLAARRRSHIAILGLVQRLPGRLRLGIGLAVQLAVILFALLLLWFGVQMTSRSLDVPSVTLFFGFGLIYAVVPLTAVLVLLYALLDLLETARHWRRA
jgi:TRAP-type C4-dicarboxylate transport system permease small subunit